MPIFGASPLGLALTRTFNRLWHEAHLPQNKGLRPAIVIISDGQPTDSDNVDLPILADKIKQLGIPIVCCFISNSNAGRSWHLPRHPGLFWSNAARLVFAMASSVEEYATLADRLQNSRFVIKKQARLFIQLNHTDYLRGFIEAALLPVHKERRAIEQVQIVKRPV